jgi:uncharacterized protein YbbC (DUF1343 family)
MENHMAGQSSSCGVEAGEIRVSSRSPFLPLFALLLVGVLIPGGGCSAPEAGTGEAPASENTPSTPVRPGIDVLLADSLHLVADRRAGLVTNHTGIDYAGRPSIDRLHEDSLVELVALFSPEHGIRGTAEAGELVDHEIDARTGLPVHSLYGETRRPTPEMLEGIEVLLFDIQDVGTRYYTYIYTMGLAMEEAGRHGIPFVILDRPNPVGGTAVQGNVLDPAFSSFVGQYPLPMRHGMTPGELARLYRDAFGIHAELHVVPVEGWRRDMLFHDTGLPWLAPSPNMPDLESALHYPGTCLFEGTNLAVGRGTDRAFQQVGAPWLDGEELARRVNARGLPGVAAEAVRFTPVRPGDGKFDGEEVGGVRLRVTDPAVYDPTLTGVALLVEARRLAGNRWEWRASHFDRLAGTDRLRLGIEEGLEPAELTRGWEGELERFLPLRARALIYR